MLSKITSLMKHQGFLRYFKNTSWMMAEQGLRLISGLFVGIWVARYLGPEQFGIFSYALAFTAIFAGIAKLGLDGIMVRELINQPQQRDMYMGTAFWLKMAGACLVMALIAAILPFTTNDATTKLYIFIITAGLVFQSFEVVDFYFQSQVMAKVVSLCKVIQLTLSSIVKIYLVLSGADLVWFVMVTALDTVTLAVCYAAAYKFKQQTVFYKCFSLTIAKRLLKDSWPLIFSALLVMIYMRIDQIMIKEMLDDYSVGVYSASVRLFEVLMMLTTVMVTAVFPSIISSRKISKDVYEKRLVYLYAFLIWGWLVLSVVFFLLSDFIFNTLYGEEYLESGDIFSTMVWVGLFSSISIVRGRWQIAENLTSFHMYGAIIAACLNVILNVIMIPLYGLKGAAYATLTSAVITGYFMNYVFPVLRTQNKLIHKAVFLRY